MTGKFEPWQIVRRADVVAFSAAASADQEKSIAMARVQIDEAADLVSAHKQAVAMGNPSLGLFAKQASAASHAANFGAVLAKAGDKRGSSLVARYEAMRSLAAGVPGADALAAVEAAPRPVSVVQSAPATATAPAMARAAPAIKVDPVKQAMVAVLAKRMDSTLAGLNSARRMQGLSPLPDLPQHVARSLAQEVREQFAMNDAAARHQSAVASAKAFNAARKASRAI
jgi:hypothetical protein